MKRAIILNLILFLTVSASAIAQTNLVPDDYPTIQAAIDDANDSDEVVLADGVYTGEGNRDIDFKGKAITVRSENGPENCIIDYNSTVFSQRLGFYFHSGEDANSVLDGFTIINSHIDPLHYRDDTSSAIYCENNSSPVITNCIMTNNTLSRGRGIYCRDSSPTIINCTITNIASGGIYCRNSSPVIKNCEITENTSYFDGGGIYCRGGNSTIENCVITGNAADDGGGIYCSSNTIITKCIITGNIARDDGGGIYCYDNTIITNCTVTGNIASDEGGGIYCYNGNPVITNCNICDNSASDRGGGIYCHSGNPVITNCTICDSYASNSGGGIYAYRNDSNPSITNCIIWGNFALRYPQLLITEDPTYSCIQNWTGGGEGNITENPQVSSGTGYKLMPYSPCIDAGTNEPVGGLPSDDLDENPRPLDGDSDGIAVTDMGAYEFQEPNKPLIAFMPTEFEFHHYIGGANTQSQTLSIWNAGPDTLNWQITEDCNWLDVSPTSSQSSGQHNEVTLTIDGTGLEPGSYNCMLTICDVDTSECMWKIPVNLFVGYTLSVPSQYSTIQAAIDAAATYDMVLVEDGIHKGNGNRDLNFRGKIITVKSANGPNNCIIDCNGSEVDHYRAFYFHNHETAKSVVDGFTLTNGHAKYGGGIYCIKFSSPKIINCIISDNLASSYGGGICCQDGSSPTITNCIIRGNLASYRGGGICCERDSRPTITNCIFSDNSAVSGGALFFYMYLFEVSSTITNCTITGNSAKADGGGIYCRGRCISTIINCVISDNCALRRGGGICCIDRSSTDIKNCIVSGNSASDRGGGICCQEGGDTTVINCTISDNSAKYGGGIYCVGGDTTITNCTIRNNSSLSVGGGISCNGKNTTITNCSIVGNSIYAPYPYLAWGGGICCNGSLVITNCLIAGNSIYSQHPIGGYGGGIHCRDRSNLIITSCTISGNSASHGGGGLYCNESYSAAVINCIFWDNIAPDGPQLYLWHRSNSWVSYTDIEGGKDDIYFSPDSELDWGFGNIDVNPMFDETGYWADVNDANIIVEPNDPNAIWVEGDYHLWEGSPCINTGDPNYIAEPNETDLDGLPRIIGGRIDMGAYEFNHLPVADAGPNQTAYAWIDDIAEVTLDGNDSYDLDGDELTYFWKWAVDSNTYEANGVSPTIELPVGGHIIELVVNDGIDDSELSESVVTVIGPMYSHLWLSPQVIHRHSFGPKRIMALVSLPRGITKNHIDESELLRLYYGDIGIEAVKQHIFNTGPRRRRGKYAIIFAAFDKAELLAAISDSGRLELQAVGMLKTGRYFYGFDTIRIKRHPRWPWRRRRR